MPTDNTFDFIPTPSSLDMKNASKDLSLLEWSYVAEGNKNVVFGNKETACVLRILKDKDSCLKGAHGSYYDNEVEEQWEYFSNVIKPLLQSSLYLLDGSLVPLSDELINTISKDLEAVRPKFRRGRGINKTIGKAFLYPHLGISPFVGRNSQTLCIELKPKWGFLPNVKSRSAGDIKHNVCRFCMFQTLKLAEGSVSVISQYCPLDLFSGCTCRIKHALASLTLNPQNNLRIFLDGKPVYGGCGDVTADVESLEKFLNGFLGELKDSSSIDHLTELITAVFLKDSFGNADVPQSGTHHCLSCYPMCPKTLQWMKDFPSSNANCIQLQNRGILKTLLSFQKMGGIDIEDIYPIFLKIMKRKDQYDDLRCFKSTAWEHVVTKLIEGEGEGEDEGEGIGMDCSQCHSHFIDSGLKAVCKFLIASTFRDCSIMISLRQDNHATYNKFFDKLSEKHYSYKIFLTDLDPKDSKRIPRYSKLDFDILQCYTNTLS